MENRSKINKYKTNGVEKKLCISDEYVNYILLLFKK